MENDYRYVELMIELITELDIADDEPLVAKMRELVRTSYDTGHDQGYKLAKRVHA